MPRLIPTNRNTKTTGLEIFIGLDRDEAAEDFAEVPPTGESPLNGRIGPHRRVDWTSMPLEESKDVRRALGCSLNDVVLCIVTGAVSSFIELRGVTPTSIDFRVGVPVSVRSEGDEALGNRVSQWIVELPLWERDPHKRLSFITQRTQHLKETNQAVAAEMLFGLAEWTGSRLLSPAARSRSSPIPINMMVTNIPGPQIPLYLPGGEVDRAVRNGAAAREYRPRHRALQLRRPPRLGIQRGLRPRSRPDALHRRNRVVLLRIERDRAGAASSRQQ